MVAPKTSSTTYALTASKKRPLHNICPYGLQKTPVTANTDDTIIPKKNPAHTKVAPLSLSGPFKTTPPTLISGPQPQSLCALRPFQKLLIQHKKSNK